MKRARDGGRDAPHKAGRPAALIEGLEVRRLAVRVVDEVLRHKLPLDEQIEKLGADPAYQALSAPDRGLTRAIALSAFRGLGTIRAALAERMPRGLPNRGGTLEAVLITASAQVLFLDVPDHAAVHTAVACARLDRDAQHFLPLANAVLRRIVAERDRILAERQPLETDVPVFFRERWIRTYGEDTARQIAAALQIEPAVDLSVKAAPEAWAARLDGIVLPTGSVRLRSRIPVQDLAGLDDGDWWVQDAAAALPARLLNVQPGEHVLDLCAAPGGKTAQLAAAGATVVAVDRSPARLARLDENMRRLNLTVDRHVADAAAFTAARPFDAILIDAPCTASGTARRHPDVLWNKTLEDLLKLSALQKRILQNAAHLLRPGGRLVYATCSLEPEEGERQIADFLAGNPSFEREPVSPAEIGGLNDCMTAVGDLRTLPFHLAHADPRLSGLDGFFAARLIRRA